MTGWDDRRGRRSGEGPGWDEVRSSDTSYDPTASVPRDPWDDTWPGPSGDPRPPRGEGRYSFSPPPPAYAQYPPPLYAHPYGYPPPYRRPPNPALPVVGGIFTILAGASSIVWFLSGWGNDSIFWEAGLNWCVALGVVLGLIGIVGGVLAMMKRLFGLALVGAICVTLSFGWFGMSFFMGLLAVILVAISKDAFDAPGAQQLPVRY